MKTNILFTLLVVSILASCKKDEYNTRPKLNFKEINSTTFSQGDNVTFTIEVTDKEGDIQDSIWVEQVTRNCTPTNIVKSKYQMPQFTSKGNLKADIRLNYIYNVTNAGFPIILSSTCTGRRNDSTIMRFWIKDKGGNISDTVVSDQFVLIK